MAYLSNEQRTEYGEAILEAIKPLINAENGGWIKSINVGPAIKSAGIDYKNLEFPLTRFLFVVFGRELQIRGEKNSLEFKFPDSILPPHHMVRNLYRDLMRNSNTQSGWVKVKDLMTRVNWQGDVTEFAKKYGLQIKTSNLVRISNISRFEILDDIYFDPQKKSYPMQLKFLGDMALDEVWDDNKPYGLLDNYLRYTYARVKEEGKLALSVDGLSGCWNTGLVNGRYLPIYCYMTRVNPSEKWVFQGFCIDGENLGKVMNSNIATRPAPPLYFTNNNLLFESDIDKLSVDYDHIIREHPTRLPEEWLKRALGKDKDKDIEKREDENQSEYDARLGNLISEDHEASSHLQNLLQDAIKISIMRCQWNYKTAIPYYDPNSKNIGWFLPLCLSLRNKDKQEPFAALVVTKENSGRYQGQTIYKLNWAYRCARLVCRPDSDWLTPSNDSSEEDE